MSESPFLPGTNIQYAWDSTSLGYLKQCPRLYQYVMIDGWTSKDESVHLRFGQEYHHALQDYDISRSAGIAHDDAVFDVVRELLVRTRDFHSEHKTKTRESLVRTVIWYLDKHKDDPSQTHLLDDGRPAVELSFRWELDWGPEAGIQKEWKANEIGIPGEEVIATQPYLLCGHLDKVISYNGDLMIKDYKTVFSFWGKKWEPDNQMTLYTLGSQIVLDSPIKGVVIDMAHILEDETKFQRDITYRTPDQLEEWLADLRRWLATAEQYAIDDYWPMNDTACGMYGGCRFREICSKSPSVRERFLEGSFIKQPEEKRWNPLRTR